MKQKFRKLTFVRICDDMPNHMKHFDSGFEGIINGTYSQIYGGKDIDSYSIFKLENGKIVNRLSWYRENQLTALEKQDSEKAEELIEEYNLRNA